MGNVLSFHIDVLHAVGPKAAVYWSWYKSVSADVLRIDSDVFRSEAGFISVCQKDVEKELGLTPAEQRTARKRLIDAGYLVQRKSGVPCRIFLQCHEESLLSSQPKNPAAGTVPSAFSTLFNRKENSSKEKPSEEVPNDLNLDVAADDNDQILIFDDKEPDVPVDDSVEMIESDDTDPVVQDDSEAVAGEETVS